MIFETDSKLTDAEAQGQRIQAIALEVASLRDVVEDIRTRVVERPMSQAEAAGETPLDLCQISLAIEDADMDALPATGASEADVQRWVREYANRASHPPESLADTDPHQAAA